ncbi:cardiolipin synthase [Exiguobacterium acetylicum]|uniref:cardiolipin synthase n=1 Tax=Exiguobacterium acetylicum TaxID=41170 RepID=UPI001EE3A106|nr:cardiolipin synthase [Exiguobacterium acetylicum]UKS57536.1 cardiolipin synthase [Exiguobacterium acetylicum]
MDYTLILSILLYAIVIANIAAAIAILFFERRDVSATWAWLMILFFVPVLGFLIYLLLGRSLKQDTFYHVPKERRRLRDHDIKMQENEPLHSDNPIFQYRKIVQANRTADALLTEATDVRTLFDGHQKFDTLLADIRNARVEINIQYFILKRDPLGERLLSALFEQAKQGVKIRILYDAVGSWKLKSKDFEVFKQDGGEVRSFFSSPLGILNLRINNRNHRKLCTIDRQIGYIGGFNVGSEYLGEDEQFGYWRDTHLRVLGPVVEELEYHFEQDWDAASRERTDWSTAPIPPLETSNDHVPIQIVTSGPNSETEYLKNMLIQMIHSAEKSIYIQSPYFIPDASFMDACKIALASGVTLKIMIPNQPDHPFVYWATYASVGELIQHGAEVYTYELGFMHAKTIVVDGKIASVGTTNIDARSFRLNFEMNAILYHQAVAEELELLFLSDIADSERLTIEKYAARPRIIRFKESISRLLSPIL